MTASSPSASRYSTLTVLVADDDDDMRIYLARCLSLFGVGHIVEAHDGREALALARAVDLVVADLAMPGLDGLALCRALRAIPSSVPVLLVSGQPCPPECEADAFLQKPFNAEALWSHVVPLLDRTRPVPRAPST